MLHKLLIGLAIVILTVIQSCSPDANKNQPTDTVKTDTISSGSKENEPSNSKDVIKKISGKYFIPIDDTKNEFVFTINQNLNLELINYKGNYEGKYLDGKVQFDDKNLTEISFSEKGEHLILTNANEISLEFREASKEELLFGTWLYGLNDYKKGARMIFNKNYSWSRPDDMFGTSKGQFKYLSEDKFSIIHFMNRNDLPATLTLVSPISSTVSWQGSMGPEADQQIRSQKSKLESINQMFN